MAKYSPEFSTTGPLAKLYKTWYDMRRRCSPVRKYNAEHYYLKGIRVCEEWNNWPVFATWAVAQGWQLGLEIDRIDNSLGYTPDNCRFVTHIEQNKNRDLVKAHRGIREGQTKRWSKPFRCVDTGEIFLTQIEAQRKHGVDRKSLRYALSGKYKQAGGLRWKYMEASE